MIQSFSIENFKSFRKANLPLARLTLLIGANASGKSNAIEAFQLLAWLASGRRLGDVIHAIREKDLNLRGTLGDFIYKDAVFDLGCDLRAAQVLGGLATLTFKVGIRVGDDGLRIVGECLQSPDLGTQSPLYEVIDEASAFSNEIQVAYNNFAKGGKKPRIVCSDQQAVFTQLSTPARFALGHKKSQQQIPTAAASLRAALEGILFLDPNPSQMRSYSFTTERNLKGDGATLSSVLYSLVEDGQTDLILEFIRSLPEQDIQGISFVKTPRDEVMVQLQESFGGSVAARDAALLSDGTLRVLAVAAALLSVAPGSTVVIEEIDNGVHPSRAEALLHNIQRIAQERNLQVLLTTHNPALLDALPLGACAAEIVGMR